MPGENMADVLKRRAAALTDTGYQIMTAAFEDAIGRHYCINP